MFGSLWRWYWWEAWRPAEHGSIPYWEKNDPGVAWLAEDPGRLWEPDDPGVVWVLNEREGGAVVEIVELPKRPVWDRVYEASFARFKEIKDDGETIASIVSLDVSPAGLTVGTPAPVGSGVQVRISGGILGTVYTLTFVVMTSGGSVLDEEVRLLLKSDF